MFSLALAGASVLCFCGNSYHLRNASDMKASAFACLKCHDGTVGPHVRICRGQRCLLTGVHSILSPYPPPGKARAYAPRSEIEKAGCLLEEGRTTCLSCHDLTKNPPRLIRRGDELCRICHRAQ